MKVVTGETMQQMDKRAIGEFGISGLALMERAGSACAAVILDVFGATAGNKAVIVAGKGNNGGDGYVIARLLQENGWDVKTIVLADSGEIAGDAGVNLHRLHQGLVTFSPAPIGLSPFADDLREATLVIDALFGTGLRNDVSGSYAMAIELINASSRPVLSVDIPSGIDAGTGKVLGVAVKASLTVTFALAKIGHVLYPGAEYCGELKVVDIGIPFEVSEAAAGVEFVDHESARLLIKKRSPQAHKGSFGHCLVVAGSTGKSGAGAMAANSAVRCGAGLVTLAVPASLNPILEVKTTEAMTLPLPDDGMGFLGIHAFPAVEQALVGKDSVAVGPGVSWNPEAALLVRRLVETISSPLVVDADGLNAVSEDLAVLLRKQSGSIILTPHPGEMSRLNGLSIAAVESDRICAAGEFALRYGVFLVLKGARTIIATPGGDVAINGSGNPGMASGGMGDVLTGILVSLLGQGYAPFDACKLGVFIHGLAADQVAACKGEIGMCATDVQEQLPYAFKSLVNE